MLGACFDPKGDLLVSGHCFPHWSHAGAIVFITFRTHDSIPSEVLEQWDRERHEWLLQRGCETGAHWTVVAKTLSARDWADFQKTFNRQREMFLDTCHGRCLLRQPELAQIVADSLVHFDGQRYRMGDFVVMPNHVHLLAAFSTAEAMKAQCDSWLHYTAFRINRAINEKGKLWQQEPFDHLVRNPKQYDYLRRYIADNPHKARLEPAEYLYRRFEG